MSGFSGPTHQGLVGDTTDGSEKKSKPNKPKEKDDAKKDDKPASDMSSASNRKRLDEGMEELVMIASNHPAVTGALTPEQQAVVDEIHKQLMAFAEASGNQQVMGEYLDSGMEGLAQFKETMGKVIKRIGSIISIILSTAKTALKKVSDRLNRLAIRNTILRRRVENAGSRLSLSDEIPLPETHPYITIKGKIPRTANDVSDAVVRMKDFFVCTHNTNAAFHTALTQAINNGTRDESLYEIKQYLGLLSNRVGAKVDQYSKMVYDSIPAGYGMVISIGNSFSDCAANLTRIHDQEVKSPMSHRADKATLLRILDNNEQFLKNINEVYGRISSRLDGEFRKNARTAETKLRGSDNYDGRAMSATLDWFGENHNKIFTKSMQMSCSVLAASMDYVYNNVVKPGEGTEDIDDTDHSGEDDGYEHDLDGLSIESDETRIGLAIAEVRARVLSVVPGDIMVVDKAMKKVLNNATSGIPLVLTNCINTFETLWHMEKFSGDQHLIDVSDDLIDLQNSLCRLINVRRDVLSYQQLKNSMYGGSITGEDLLFSSRSTYLNYDHFDLRITSQAIKPCEEIYELIKTHIRILSDSFDSEDILLSNLIDKLTTVDKALWPNYILLTGQYMVDSTSKRYGDITLPSHSLIESSLYKDAEDASSSDTGDVDFRFNIDRCVKLHNQFSALHVEYTDLYSQVNNVFKVIVSSLLTTPDRSWVSSAFTYLSVLIGTIRWLTALHNDVMSYLLALSKQMIAKQSGLAEQ